MDDFCGVTKSPNKLIDSMKTACKWQKHSFFRFNILDYARLITIPILGTSIRTRTNMA